MAGNNIPALAILHFSLALCVIVAGSVLAALHDIDAQAVTVLFGTAIGLVGGTGASFASVLRNGQPKANGTNGGP